MTHEHVLDGHQYPNATDTTPLPTFDSESTDEWTGDDIFFPHYRRTNETFDGAAEDSFVDDHRLTARNLARNEAQAQPAIRPSRTTPKDSSGSTSTSTSSASVCLPVRRTFRRIGPHSQQDPVGRRDDSLRRTLYSNNDSSVSFGGVSVKSSGLRSSRSSDADDELEGET